MRLPSVEQTKDGALDLLLELGATSREAMEDERLREAASDDLIAAVFELAWKHQWDRTHDDFLRAVRPIVDQAVAEAVVRA